MQILIIEPYYGGSHQAWVDGYKKHSEHDVILLTLPAQFWKWRMQGGAVTIARLFVESQLSPDVILVSDMMDVSTFRALTYRWIGHVPLAIYFHENQLTYPQNTRQKHGWQYGFINFVSAMSADAVFFNSKYHYDTFFKTLPNMLKHFGDMNELESIAAIRQKSSVLWLGMDLRKFDEYRVSKESTDPLILWNHRWEEDKNPRLFFEALNTLVKQEVRFKVAIAGENFRRVPQEFETIKEQLGERIVQYEYVPLFEDYAKLLWQSDFVVSTSNQDFFGTSMAEAIYCGCLPIMPNRLNYPYLIPDNMHEMCLYDRDRLSPLLLHHLENSVKLKTSSLQSHISQFDWSIVAPVYDQVLEGLL